MWTNSSPTAHNQDSEITYCYWKNHTILYRQVITFIAIHTVSILWLMCYGLVFDVFNQLLCLLSAVNCLIVTPNRPRHFVMEALVLFTIV